MASYTFHQNTNIKYRNDKMDINIPDKTIKFDKHISECYYSERNTYCVFYNSGVYIEITTPRIPRFEAIFPEFPYIKSDDKHNDLVNKINNLEQLVITTNNRIDKVVSHLETLMIALGQRKASEENLDI